MFYDRLTFFLKQINPQYLRFQYHIQLLNVVMSHFLVRAKLGNPSIYQWSLSSIVQVFIDQIHAFSGRTVMRTQCQHFTVNLGCQLFWTVVTSIDNGIYQLARLRICYLLIIRFSVVCSGNLVLI